MKDENNMISRDNTPEEGEIDLVELAKKLWVGRKVIFYSIGVAFVLGLFVALFSPKQYTVSTVLVPQLSSSGGSSSLKSLASLAGFDLGGSTQSAELTPIVYPQIVSSIPFQLELMRAPIHFQEVDTALSYFDYVTIHKRGSILLAVKKYTIGLPGLILGAVRKPTEELVLPVGDASKLINLSEEEERIRKSMEQMITLVVNSKEGYLTLTASGPEPLATAELAQKAQELLQREIIKFKVEKSQAELTFIQERYDEVKREAEYYQEQVAENNDRSKSTVSSRSQVEMARIQSKYTIANSVYLELAKQLEQAKLQVKKDTPVFTVLKPVTVPREKSKPKRAQIMVVYLFLGGVVGAGIVWGKDWLVTLKEKWNAPADNQKSA